ncbi:MAG: CCA tRNA nucleotidyltransferase, partial [Alphaproteobacteria bacterium]|nr:CCA tRNA nucleotidyltransferase [Alphaproteobacteria bacterium]
LLRPGLDADAVAGVAERLKFSNAERKHLLAMCAPGPDIDDALDDRALRRIFQDVGGDIAADRALLTWAGVLALESHLPRARTEAWIGLVNAAKAWEPISFPLQGRDVLARGVAHGPEVGHLLKEVEAWWRTEDFRPDRDACLVRLDAAMAG